MNIFIKDPETGKPSEMITLTVIVTLAAVVRFLFDGTDFNIAGHVLKFGHVDSMTYLAFLSPIVGAHAFIGMKKKEDEK